MYGFLKRGVTQIVLDFKKCSTASYPNIVTPLSGIINYYIEVHKFDFSFKLRHNCYLSTTFFEKPIKLANNIAEVENNIFDKVIEFTDSKDASLISKYLIDQISKLVVVEDGILVGISWCLNEVIDNVLMHSEKQKGFFMTQIHNRSKHIVIAIYDTGIGLFNSFSKSIEHHPKNELEAIELAIKEGVTRDKSLGQGNGLWGLNKIIEENKGELAITTGRSTKIMKYCSGETNSYSNLPLISQVSQTTLVDFSIYFSRFLNVSKALNNYEPYEYITRQIEEMETMEGWIKINILEVATDGTGTRPSGEKVRKHVLNILKMTGKCIELDFSEVQFVSSSFIDETIGKLFVELGFSQFNNFIRITNTTDFISGLINKVIIKRQLINLY